MWGILWGIVCICIIISWSMKDIECVDNCVIISGIGIWMESKSYVYWDV